MENTYFTALDFRSYTDVVMKNVHLIAYQSYQKFSHFYRGDKFTNDICLSLLA